MKMSDVFELPLTAVQHAENHGWWTVDKANSLDSIDESADGGFEEDTAKAIARAINNHDALVEALDWILHNTKKVLAGQSVLDMDEAISHAEKTLSNALRDASR